MAWYNKYRPTKFEEVIGQELVKSVLEKALEKNRIKHAYLFSGPKGVGKTTLARIFANSLNEVENKPETTMDIVEMDAASNTGIDDIRQLIESAQNPPISGNYKIYIIDEVHMLSKSAMNALLKILEEPPKYLVFLLATTNPEKLLPTVLSRLTKLNLTNHTAEDIQSNLKQISEKEGLKVEDKALKLIAKRSGGGQRDAINLLETVASYGLDEYTVDQVSEFLGLLPEEEMENLAEVLLTEDNNEPLKQIIVRMEAKGFDGETFLAEFLEFLIDKSFEGVSDFESLILPTAEVLDLKLPVTSLTSAIAILTAKVNEKSVSVKKKPKIKLQTSQNNPSPLRGQPLKKGQEENNNPSPLLREVPPQGGGGLGDLPHSEGVVSNLQNPQNASHFDPLEGVDTPNIKDVDPLEGVNELSGTKTPHSGEMSEGQRGWGDLEEVGNQKEVSETQILQVLKSLSGNPKCPPAYRMFMGDLGVEKLSDSKIKVTVSSGIFQVTLRSSVVINLIKEELKKQFGQDFEVETGLRNGKPSQIEDQNSSVFSDDVDNSGFMPPEEIEQSSFSSEDVVFGESEGGSFSSGEVGFSSEQSKPEQTSDYSHIEKGEIFYKIYKKLPENIDPQKIGVINHISLPEEPEKWDDNTADMFDFE